MRISARCIQAIANNYAIRDIKENWTDFFGNSALMLNRRKMGECNRARRHLIKFMACQRNFGGYDDLDGISEASLRTGRG